MDRGKTMAKKEKISISIDKELLEKLKKKAETENRPLSNMIEVMLQANINQ